MYKLLETEIDIILLLSAAPDAPTGNAMPSQVLQPDNQHHRLSASLAPHPTVFFTAAVSEAFHPRWKQY